MSCPQQNVSTSAAPVKVVQLLQVSYLLLGFHQRSRAPRDCKQCHIHGMCKTTSECYPLSIVKFFTRLADLIPHPQAREPLTLHSFLRGVLLPILCYYATAVLVILPNTLLLRWALLPLTLWTTFWGATRVDLIRQFDDERLVYWNQGFLVRSYSYIEACSRC